MSTWLEYCIRDSCVGDTVIVATIGKRDFVLCRGVCGLISGVDLY